MSKDATEDLAEKTVIKTNTMKDTQETSQVETISLGSMQAEGTEGSQEEMVVAPDISSFEGRVEVSICIIIQLTHEK